MSVTSAVYDPTDVGIHADPYPLYATLRADAPLSHNRALGFWTLARHDDVAGALQDRETYASSARSLSAADRFFGIREAAYVAGDSCRHDALRQALRGVLGTRAVAGREPEIQRIAHHLLDALSGAGVVDLAAGYARRLPVLVTCLLLGLPAADEPRLAAAVDAVFGRRPGVVDVPAAAGTAYDELCSYLNERAHDRQPGALAELEAARDRGILTASEVTDVAFILVAAGIKTTSTLVSAMLLALSRDPAQCELAWTEAARAADVVEETLRHDAPAQWVARVTTREAVTPHGVIPAGKRVLLLLGSANRDERRYPHPDSFDLTRERRRHLAFGDGLHFCLGAALARLEARVALEALIARADPPRPAGPPERIFTPAERELAALPLVTAVAPRHGRRPRDRRPSAPAPSPRP
jgi:cytochrome P450